MCRTGQAIGQAMGQAVDGFAVDGLGSQRLAGNGLGSRLQAVYMFAAWSPFEARVGLHIRALSARTQTTTWTTLDGGLGKRSDASVCDEPRAGRAVCRCRVRGGPGPRRQGCSHATITMPAGAGGGARPPEPPSGPPGRGPVGHAHDHVMLLAARRGAAARGAAARGSSNRRGRHRPSDRTVL